MEFDYTVTTAKNFVSAVVDVQQEIAKSGMRVMHVHDVQQTLAEKGFNRAPFKIIEFCNARYASEFLKADVKIGLCMPCKINVYSHDDQTFITGLRPTVLPKFFPHANVGSMPAEIDAAIRSIIDHAK